MRMRSSWLGLNASLGDRSRRWGQARGRQSALGGRPGWTNSEIVDDGGQLSVTSSSLGKVEAILRRGRRHSRPEQTDLEEAFVDQRRARDSAIGMLVKPPPGVMSRRGMYWYSGEAAVWTSPGIPALRSGRRRHGAGTWLRLIENLGRIKPDRLRAGSP